MKRIFINSLFYFLCSFVPIWIYLRDGMGYMSIPFLFITIILILPHYQLVPLYFKEIGKSRIGMCSFLLLFYSFMVIFLNHQSGSHVQSSPLLAELNYRVLISWVVQFFCGIILYQYYYAINMKFVFLLIGISTSLFIIFSADPGTNTLYFDYVKRSDSPYLFMSDRYTLIAVFALVPFFITNNYTTKAKSIVLSIVCLIAIFTIGSRTMLYAYIICASAIFFFIKVQKGKYLTLIVSSILLFFFVVMLITYAQAFRDYDGIGRMLAIFYNIGDDGSVEGRMIQYAVGLIDIVESPILGNYAGDVAAFGAGGNNIHGFLAYWRQFGVIPFMLICTIVFLTVKQFTLSIFVNGASERDVFFLFLSLLFSLSLVFSRTYISSAMYFCVGAAVISLISARKASKVS